MRKSNKRQRISEQPKVGGPQEGRTEPTTSSAGGTDLFGAGQVELLSRLREQRVSTANLLEEIVSTKNLGLAYTAVSRNKGSGGVDGMDIATTGAWLRQHLASFQTEILEESYEVSAVRKVEIPKPTGGVRLLGVPTIKDRIVQQSIHQVLSRYYEPHFSEHSYGFRPNRRAQDAIARSSEYVQAGYEWVVDIDLEKFFDKINHDRLMNRLKQGIGDKRLLRLINKYLKAGLMSEGLVEQRTAGTPQGGPLSPLLSNIVLDELDRELEKRGHKFCRYADDCNIYVKSEKAGHRVMESVIKFIEEKLKLRVNRAKSGVRHCESVKFLGFTVMKDGGIRVADKSKERLKDKIRECCKRNRGVKFAQVIKELNEVIVGWTSYFRKANTWIKDLENLDGWTRRKLRCYRLKQSQKKYSTYKLLVSLGAKVGESWNVVMYSQGWWAMSNKRTVNRAMSPKWFAEQGLRSIYAEMTRTKY
jgi:RNA-directed DNA polymerase